MLIGDDVVDSFFFSFFWGVYVCVRENFGVWREMAVDEAVFICLLIRKDNSDSNISYNFQLHSIHIFFFFSK